MYFSTFKMGSGSGILVLILSSVAVWGDDTTGCPSGLNDKSYLRISGKLCYEFAIFRETYWDSAEAECAHNGGHLVTIPNAETQVFIQETLTNLGYNHNGIWIGLNDRSSEGQVVWTSGANVTFVYWAEGEPSFFKSIEDCVIMKSTKAYKWEDHPCHLWPQHYSYICEYALVPTTTVASTSSQR